MSDEASTQSAFNRPDPLWVQAIKQREPAVWTELVETYGQRLRNDILQSLHKRGLSVEHVDDAAQTTWLRALQNISGFEWKDGESFYHWLRVMASYITQEMSHSNRREESIDDNQKEDLDAELDIFLVRYRLDDRGIEDIIERRAFMRALDLALRKLKPKEQEIFVRWLCGEPPRNLVAEFNMTAHEVSQALWRTKRKVEAYLRDTLG